MPADEQADELLLLRWEAAERDCALLYDGEYVYERHIDELSLDDAKEFSAFCFLLSRSLFRSGDQHAFAMKVTDDIEALSDDQKPE